MLVTLHGRSRKVWGAVFVGLHDYAQLYKVYELPANDTHGGMKWGVYVLNHAYCICWMWNGEQFLG